MPTERQSPDALLTQTNLSGTLAAIDEDPDSPDANWLTYITNNVDTVCRVSFPTPTGNPTVGAGKQQFKIWVRQQPDGAGADPTVRIELYENGGSLATVLANTAVSSTSGALYSGTWNANLLANANGSGVECYIYGTAVGGGPSNRCTVEVGAVEWNVEYDEAPPAITGTGAVTVQAATLAGPGKQTFAASGALAAAAVTLAGSGKETFAASGALSAPAVTLAAVGKLAFVASGGVVVPLVALAGAGKEAFSGTGAIAAAAAALAGVGKQTFAGTATIAAAAAALAAEGQVSTGGGDGPSAIAWSWGWSTAV